MEELSLQQARLCLGAAAILSLSETARLLPMADGKAREWLRRNGLVRDLAGRSVVIWGDVIDELRRVKIEDVRPTRASIPRRDFRG